MAKGLTQTQAESLAESLAPATHTEARWRVRGELRIEPIGRTVPPRWNVFDPLTRQSYRIGWLEHVLLQSLQRPMTFQQALTTLSRQAPGLDRSQVLEAFRSLQQNRMITLAQRELGNTEPAPQRPMGKRLDASRNQLPQPKTQQLLDAVLMGWRQVVLGWNALFKLVASLLVVQLRGPNPEHFLKRIAPRLGFLFSRQAVGRWLIVVAITCLAVLANLGSLLGEVGSWMQILQPATGGSLLLIVLLTRCLHELGHAVACTRHGIRCPDVGIYVFCGAPCLYCDVSESWRLTRRSQRASVAAAGMYTELIVAVAAAWLWLLTDPGTLHAAAMHTMLVCSIGTLVVNANPLLRFDGYYILADWLDEPNLRQRADRIASETLLNVSQAVPRLQLSITRRIFYVTFSLGSLAFRLSISVGIAIALATLLSRWNMELLGSMLAAGLLLSWWGGPVVRSFSTLFSSRDTRSRATLLAWGCVLVWCLTVVPLPVRTSARGWLEPQNVQGIYCTEDALLEDCLVENGEWVQPGSPLFRLQSDLLEVQRAAATREWKVCNVELQHALFRQHESAAAGRSSTLPSGPLQAKAELARQELAELDRRTAELTIIATSSGIFLADPTTDAAIGPSRKPSEPNSTLTTWADDNQRGRCVAQGSRLGVIHSDSWRVIVPIASHQLASVRAGTRVKLRIGQDRSQVLEGSVEAVVELAEQRESWQPAPALPNGTMSQSPASSGAGNHTFYAARLDLPTSKLSSGRFKPGSVVDAVFTDQPASLMQRGVRWARSNVGWLQF